MTDQLDVAIDVAIDALDDIAEPVIGPVSEPDDPAAQERRFVEDFTRMSMLHKFAIDEVRTKINILREEFVHLHDYNPIEHVNWRLKTLDSVVAKARRRGCELTVASVRDAVRDIAGVRVVCSFVADVYHLFEVLTAQADVIVVEVDDYITEPKPNGYRSLHATIEVPVFLSTGAEYVYVELQLRTVAMDFWASLEHKIYYKYDREVPDSLLGELKEAAEIAAALDGRMQRLHREVASLD
ncbi:MAG TPA: GTP pyrophosphokinase family protein [Ilumatobacteraceae bacterium]|nr:GTP pyrophosphokinase family protein [Ilumatobacteraceae bacterium]